MAGLLQGIFMPREKAKKAKINLPAAAPTEAAAAEGVADVTKSRQGRGLSSLNLSGMRSMVNSAKATLGAG